MQYPLYKFPFQKAFLIDGVLIPKSFKEYKCPAFNVPLSAISCNLALTCLMTSSLNNLASLSNCCGLFKTPPNYFTIHRS